MQTETFRGRDLHGAMAMARARLGEDVLLVRTRWLEGGATREVEVVATTPAELRRIQQHIAPAAAPAAAGIPGSRGGVGVGRPARPHVVALVGPTGAGKTTTAAKLALSDEAFGTRRVGLITLDTYRVAALEQIQLYADIAGLPCEALYDEADLEPTLARLADCDVLIVDSPGRSPRGGESANEWRSLLRRLEPAEVHLVLPATIRADVACSLREDLRDLGITHALITKLDEVPHELGVLDLAETLDLPARWAADGQDVPADLRPAASRLLGSLGMEELIARAG
jgi:flagellar biosynthesis protein FlhF